MTCIIGYQTGGKVYMGGDSCGYGSNSDSRIFKNPKVFKLRVGNILCGYTWTYRYGQVLKQVLKNIKPKWGDSIQDWLIETFVPALIAKMDEQKILEIEDGMAKVSGALLGIQGRIFVILNDLSVVEPDGNLFTLGSGYQYAIGALAAIEDAPAYVSGLTPKGKIHRALEITAQYCPSVREPFTIIESQRKPPCQKQPKPNSKED